MDCKSKMNSIKSVRYDSVYLGSFDEKSPFVYNSIFVFDKTINHILTRLLYEIK